MNVYACTLNHNTEYNHKFVGQNHFCVGFRIWSKSSQLNNSQIICQTQTTRLCISSIYVEIALSSGKSGVVRNEGKLGGEVHMYHMQIRSLELQVGGGEIYIKGTNSSLPPLLNEGPACLYLGYIHVPQRPLA